LPEDDTSAPELLLGSFPDPSEELPEDDTSAPELLLGSFPDSSEEQEIVNAKAKIRAATSAILANLFLIVFLHSK
jgi:hypothetical protein